MIITRKQVAVSCDNGIDLCLCCCGSIFLLERGDFLHLYKVRGGSINGTRFSKVEFQEVTMNVGIDAPLHLHPCPTVGVVTEGQIVFEIEGDQTRHLKVGDAFYEPADARVAKFNNDGDTTAKFVVFYLLGENEKETIRILEE